MTIKYLEFKRCVEWSFCDLGSSITSGSNSFMEVVFDWHSSYSHAASWHQWAVENQYSNLVDLTVLVLHLKVDLQKLYSSYNWRHLTSPN